MRASLAENLEIAWIYIIYAKNPNREKGKFYGHMVNKSDANAML